MTGKAATTLLPAADPHGGAGDATVAEWLAVLAFGAIQWPWLLRSLSGGPDAERARLLKRVGLPQDALPTLGSWKADTALLHRIVDTVERHRPQHVVELGAGATTLVTARALARNGSGHLTSYDQHARFVQQTREWLREYGIDAGLRAAPMARHLSSWPGYWYRLTDLPDRIDLLVVDGPNWTLHPLVRGAAEMLFDRIAPGGTVLLDDAARPGERLIANRWRRRWPDFTFTLDRSGSKGTLIGKRRA